MLIPISLIVAFGAGVATAVPVTVWVHGLVVKAKAFVAQEKAAAIAEVKKLESAVVAEIPKV